MANEGKHSFVVGLILGLDCSHFWFEHRTAVDSAMLLTPPTDSWPQYHRNLHWAAPQCSNPNYSLQNVANLTLTGLFKRTRISLRHSSSPILVNGVLYFLVVNNVWASTRVLAAKSGTTFIVALVAVFLWAIAGLPRTRIRFSFKPKMNASFRSMRKTVCQLDRGNCRFDERLWTTAAPLVVKNPCTGWSVYRLR